MKTARIFLEDKIKALLENLQNYELLNQIQILKSCLVVVYKPIKTMVVVKISEYIFIFVGRDYMNADYLSTSQWLD